MRKIPVDINKVLKIIGDVNREKGSIVRVVVVVDPSAPEDVRTCVTLSFSSHNPQAQVTVQDMPEDVFQVASDTDLVVIVAGFSKNTGAVAKRSNESGVPALVVTTMPEIVEGIAQREGFALSDVVVPGPVAEDAKFGVNDDFNQEPYPLTVDRAQALQMNIGAWIVDVFRKKRTAFAQCFPFLRFPLANELVNAASMQNAGVGFVVIIPGADLPVMTLNQMRVVLQIAAIYGASIDFNRVKELAAVFGSAFGWRALARELCSALPGLGWVLKAGVGYSGTQAIGRAAIAYFEKQAGEDVMVVSSASPIRSEFAHLARTAREQTSIPEAACAVAKKAADDAKQGVADAASRCAPQARKTVEAVSSALGTTPQGLGRAVVEGVMNVAANRRA